MTDASDIVAGLVGLGTMNPGRAKQPAERATSP